MIIGCMSVFNEAAQIETAIKSLSWCDKIVVVDGSYKGFPEQGISKDRTMWIADKLGCHIILAQAGLTQVQKRNMYLIGRPGDYYVVLDGDEVWHGEIGDLEARAYRVKHAGSGWIPPTIRIFRHGARYKKAHNQLYIGKERIDEPLSPLMKGVHIEHRKHLRTQVRKGMSLKYFLYQINEEKIS